MPLLAHLSSRNRRALKQCVFCLNLTQERANYQILDHRMPKRRLLSQRRMPPRSYPLPAARLREIECRPESFASGWAIERRTALKKSSNGPASATLVVANRAKIDNQRTIVRTGRFTMMRDITSTLPLNCISRLPRASFRLPIAHAKWQELTSTSLHEVFQSLT